MSLEYVIFVSSSVGDLADSALESLLVTSRRRNDECGVTGVLLYHDGSFFQYFEGPSIAVDTVYAHIRRSRLHHDIIELDRGALRQRQFSDWQMGLTHASKSKTLSLATASWNRLAKAVVKETPTSHGLALLLGFWRTTGRERWGVNAWSTCPARGGEADQK